MLTLFTVLVLGGQPLALFGHWLSAIVFVTCYNY